MDGKEWEKIKIADRLAARQEWHADPEFARQFFATWGAGEGACILGAECLTDDPDKAHWIPGEDPLCVNFD